MVNRVMTQKLVKAAAKYGDAVEQELEELIVGGSVTRNDIDLTIALEHDFGPDWRNRVKNVNRVGNDAMEAIITSGTFNKFVQAQIRATLRETPKEAYKLSNLVATENKGECEGPFKDMGVFTDMKWHPVCELEAPPLYGIGSDYQQHPQGVPGGLGVAWTREALCADPNGYLAGLIKNVRDAHDEERENQLLDAFIGYTQSYNRTGTLYDTYYESGSVTPFENGGPWVNASANGFYCWSDLTEVKEMFWDMTDMVHGRTIDIDTDNLTVVTSMQEANRMRPLLLSQAVECDNDCAGDGQTCKYIMTADVANGVTFDLIAYKRFVDRIMLRYGVTRAAAEKWWWVGKLSDFIGWAYNITPEVTRCPLGSEECRKRIVAVYTSHSKGYSWIKDPHKGILMTGEDTASVSASESA
jgi:hypothetical protein